jgi:hypothetical protein
MKNEAPFVLEWIAYHKIIGFDEIVICSNPSNDGMEELLEALAEAGEIRHLRATVPAGARPQLVASRTYSAEVGYRENDWYLWLDADEFLNVHVGKRTVSDLIEAMSGKSCAMLNWRIFGSSGNKRFQGRFVDQHFSGAAVPEFPVNGQVKTLFRKSAFYHGFGLVGVHRPLVAVGSDLRPEDIVTGNGGSPSHSSRRHRRWLNGEDFGRSAYVSPGEFGWALAQINHYIVRTPELFALKRQRGRGYKADAVGEANQRHTDDFFAQHDRNEAEDRSILFWESRVTEEIARLMDIPLVAEAKQRSDDLVRVILSQVESTTIPEAVTGMIPSDQLHAPELPAAASGNTSFALTFPRKEANLVRRMYAQASTILEYGSGGSTLLGAGLGKKIISVESDRDWADRLSSDLTPFPGAAVHYADIGPTGKWGMPSRPRFHGRFHRYALSVWDRPDLGDPDLVLIDGRFRAACLAAVILRARRPTTVLFDDYEDRPCYSGVEKLVRKEETVGRMARFVVTPCFIPPEMLTEVIGWFSDPR